jgi:hypothetical protein
MRNLTLIVGFCGSLIGCETTQQNQQKSQAAIEMEEIASTLRNADTSFKLCREEVKKSELYKRLYEEIFFETDESPNKFAMLSNNNKLTNEQIEYLKNAIPILTKCRSKLIDGQRHTPFQVVSLKYFNAIDAVYIKLIKGEMTIGDANEERAKASAQRKIDWANAGNDLDTRLRTLHESEMAGRRQAAAAMLPYLVQQRQNQQFREQMLYQQQMQDLINNRPVLTAPTTTNCSTFANQISCTTR